MNLELKIEDFEYHNIHFPPNTLSFYGFKFKPQITDLLFLPFNSFFYRFFRHCKYKLQLLRVYFRLKTF